MGACDGCRLRKIKCSGPAPCRGCTRIGIPCTFEQPRLRRGPRRSRTESAIAKLKSGSSLGVAVADCEPEESEDESLQRAKISKKHKTKHNCPSSYDGAPPGFPTAWGHADLLSLEEIRELVDSYFQSQHMMALVLQRHVVMGYLDKPPTPVTYTLVLGICMSSLLFNSRSPKLITQILLEASRIDYRSTSSISEETALASYFLFVAHFNLEQFAQSWLYLRDCMTMVQVMGLDRQETYDRMKNAAEIDRLRLLYFCLYITERGASMLTKFPLTLKRTVPYPEYQPGTPQDSMLRLARLFSLVDDYIIMKGDSQMTEVFAESLYNKIEAAKELAKDIESEVHRVDFLISTEWLRLLIWKAFQPKCSNNVQIMYSITDGIVQLGRELTSSDILGVHGVGMAMKLTDILHSLAEVYGMSTAFEGVVANEPNIGKRIVKLLDLIVSFRETRELDLDQVNLDKMAPLSFDAQIFGNTDQFLYMLGNEDYFR